jgi:hypothetical protein
MAVRPQQRLVLQLNRTELAVGSTYIWHPVGTHSSGIQPRTAESQTRTGIHPHGRSTPRCYCLPQVGYQPTHLKDRLVPKLGPCIPEDSIDRLAASPVSAERWQRIYGFRSHAPLMHTLACHRWQRNDGQEKRPTIPNHGICSRLRQQYRGSWATPRFSTLEFQTRHLNRVRDLTCFWNSTLGKLVQLQPSEE